MGQNYDDIVTNERRMTVEKRGEPAGVVAWRFITHGDQIDTEGAEREFVNFQASRTYFFQATWRNNFINRNPSRAAPMTPILTSFTLGLRLGEVGRAPRRSIRRSSGRCGFRAVLARRLRTSKSAGCSSLICNLMGMRVCRTRIPRRLI